MWFKVSEDLDSDLPCPVYILHVESIQDLNLLSKNRSSPAVIDDFSLSGLWTLARCLKLFPTEPKHFLPLRRSMVSTCASSACTCRSTAPSALSQTLGQYLLTLLTAEQRSLNKPDWKSLLALLCPCADVSTYPTWTVFTSSDLGFCGRQCTTKSSSAIWNMSRNSGRRPCPTQMSGLRVGSNRQPNDDLDLSLIPVFLLVLLSGTRRATSGRARRVKATTTFSTAILPTRRSRSPRDCRSGTERCWTMPLRRGFCTTTK